MGTALLLSAIFNIAYSILLVCLSTRILVIFPSSSALLILHSLVKPLTVGFVNEFPLPDGSCGILFRHPGLTARQVRFLVVRFRRLTGPCRYRHLSPWWNLAWHPDCRWTFVRRPLHLTYSTHQSFATNILSFFI